METQIERLSEQLDREPEWQQALERLQADEPLRFAGARTAAQITYYFAHEENLIPLANEFGWRSLLLQVAYFFRELDSSGASQIIGRLAPEHLLDFSYREASEFRMIEEGQIPELNVPPEAWEVFWGFIDENKNAFLSEMREYRPYSAYRHFLSHLEGQMEYAPTSFRHLSPFKWSKAVAGGLGTGLGIVDTLGGVLTLPFGGGLAVASILGAMVAGGYCAGAE